MRRDHLDAEMVREAIVNSGFILKRIRSKSPGGDAREYLYEFFDLFRASPDVRHCEPAEGGRSNLLWSNFFGEIASLRSQ